MKKEIPTFTMPTETKEVICKIKRGDILPAKKHMESKIVYGLLKFFTPTTEMQSALEQLVSHPCETYNVDHQTSIKFDGINTYAEELELVVLHYSYEK